MPFDRRLGNAARPAVKQPNRWSLPYEHTLRINGNTRLHRAFDND